MSTEIGEYLVGAYLKMVEGCDFVDYNVRPPGGGLKGLEEIDVVGFDFKNNSVYLCEVTTHILGLNYVNEKTTIERINKKYNRLKTYATQYLDKFGEKKYMFWSPVVSDKVEKKLKEIEGLDLIINKKYTFRVNKLRKIAKKAAHDTGNPFFRVLQVLEHLKKFENTI